MAANDIRTVPITAAPQGIPLSKSMININTREELVNPTERLAEQG